MADLISNDEILEFLQNNTFEELFEVKTREAASWKDKYDVLDSGYSDYSFQYNGNSFIFRVSPNLVTYRLYFSIFDSSSEKIQSFMPLSEYPINLALCKELNGATLYYYNNKVWFKDAVL